MDELDNNLITDHSDNDIIKQAPGCKLVKVGIKNGNIAENTLGENMLCNGVQNLGNLSGDVQEQAQQEDEKEETKLAISEESKIEPVHDTCCNNRNKEIVPGEVGNAGTENSMSSVISSSCPTARTTSVSVTQASLDPMMDLSSANSIFMQARPSNIEPLYTSKQLPRYLQDSLTESLSKITIQDEKYSEEQEIQFADYTSEGQLPDLTELITKDLSEPYSIYTYRYFLHNWPHLSFLVSVH